jgi:hypothetical protein
MPKKATISKLDEFKRHWDPSEHNIIRASQGKEQIRQVRRRSGREKKAMKSVTPPHWDQKMLKRHEKEDAEIREINAMMEEKYPKKSFPANQPSRRKNVRRAVDRRKK